MLCGGFFPVRETGMSNGEKPKEGSNPNSDHGQDTQTGDAVEDRIEDEAEPLLANNKIKWWDEDEAQIYHMIFLSVWFVLIIRMRRISLDARWHMCVYAR